MRKYLLIETNVEITVELMDAAETVKYSFSYPYLERQNMTWIYGKTWWDRNSKKFNLEIGSIYDIHFKYEDDYE